MTARPLSAALALDRLQAAALIKALVASPVVLLGGGALVILATIRLTLLVDELALGVDAALAAAFLAAALMLALTVTMTASDRAREGPLGFAFVDPVFTARLAMIRAGLAAAPILTLILAMAAWRRTDLILPLLAGLSSGGLSGLVLGSGLGQVRARLSRLGHRLPAVGKSAPVPRIAPAVVGVGAAALLAVAVFRLQAQDAGQAAGLVAAAGVGLAALGAVKVDTTRFALIAGLPVDLSRTTLPLIPLPLLVVGAVAAGMLLLLGAAPGPALGLGLFAGLAAAVLRVILTLSSLGRSRIGAQQAAPVELLILGLIGISGLFVLAPLWLLVRLIWLWRRAERVRWREAAI